MKKLYFLLGFIIAASLMVSYGAKAATTVCNVFSGCTGWGAIQSGAIPYGNGTSPLATTTAGTNGNVLGLQGGIPVWIATTTYVDGTGITHTFSNNTLTITNAGVISLGNGTGITCSGTNPGSCSISAPVSIANGGTNAPSLGSNLILTFNGTAIVSSSTPTAAAYLATSTTATSTFLGAFQVGSTPSLLVTTGGETATCESKPATSTSMVLDWSNTCPEVLIQMGGVNSTTTLINATTSAMVGSRKLVTICNPNGTAGIMAIVGAEWFGGTAPTQTTTANQCDAYSFYVTQATSTSAAYKVFGAQSAGAQ